MFDQSYGLNAVDRDNVKGYFEYKNIGLIITLFSNKINRTNRHIAILK